MSSPSDAFRLFGKQKKGFMSFGEFECLVDKLSEQSCEKMVKPDFTVLKDMFDVIDIGRDGTLDYREWITTFQNLGMPSIGSSFFPEPLTHGKKNSIKNVGPATKWMGGPEHHKIGAAIAKNRHNL